MLRTLNHKLVYRPTGVSELYDLQVDPLELNNVYQSSEHAVVGRQLEAQLLQWIVQTSDVIPYTMDSRGM